MRACSGRRERARAALVGPALALALAAGACASIVDLDVTHDRGAVNDLDEGGASDDGGASPEGAPTADARAGADARADGPPAFAACACPIDQGCCVPGSGAGTCTAPSAASTCASGGGIFLRCVASDVDNGRACCLASDVRSSFFAATCSDAGAQLCKVDGECASGTCQTLACRSVVVSVCAPEGGALPACPP